MGKLGRKGKRPSCSTKLAATQEMNLILITKERCSLFSWLDPRSCFDMLVLVENLS